MNFQTTPVPITIPHITHFIVLISWSQTPEDVLVCLDFFCTSLLNHISPMLFMNSLLRYEDKVLYLSILEISSGLGIAHNLVFQDVFKT